MRLGVYADGLEEDERVLWLEMALKDMSNDLVEWSAMVSSASLKTSYAFVGLWLGGDAGLSPVLVLGALWPSDTMLCTLLVTGSSPATSVLSGTARPVLCSAEPA